MQPNLVCWSAADAKAVLRTLALEGNEYLFLATHSPISGFEVGGTRAHDVSEASEQALLDAFAHKRQQHVACVVEGEPGAGKSHLIRWLKVRWPHADDVVLLVERADGSLEGTLRELQRNLPDEFRDLLSGVQPRTSLTVDGRAALLLSNLAIGMRPGVFEKAFDDEAWCEQWDVPSVLQARAVQQLWSAPNRILEIVSGQKGENRYSEVAQFVLGDVVRLVDLQHNMFRELRHSMKATRFVRALAREATQYSDRVNAGLGGGELEAHAAAEMPESSRLIAALNRRLNFAIQGLLGISGAALQEAFGRLRRRLREQKKRLVLLLEDVTSAQGVDLDLLQVVVTPSTTQPELCDQISVVGITPGYYRDFLRPQGNIVQRLTHHVVLGRAGGEFQDVASLRDEESQKRFAARYLRVIRAGAAATERAVAEQKEVPNRCDACDQKRACHQTFGAHDGVGLYPLTGRAVARMFTALRPEDGGMTLQTPRGMIQAVLAPTFDEPEVLLRAEYPGRTVETAWHPESARRVLNGLIEHQIEEQPVGIRERLRRVVAWWGEPGPGASEEGTWAGLSRGLVEAFSLPWLGSDSVHQGTPRPTEAEPSRSRAAPSPPVERSPQEPKPPAARKPAAARGLGVKQRLNQLAEWIESGTIDDADNFWRGRVRTIVLGLPWEQEAYSRWLCEAVFTVEAILLQGSGQQRALHFVLPAEAWVRSGLAASLQLEKLEELSADEQEFNFVQLSRFIEKVRAAARAHLARRVPSNDDGTQWDYAGTLTQVLLTRAWLRGATDPEAPLVEQWETVLADDLESTEAPGSRVDSWARLYEGLVHSRVSLHEHLRSIVGERGPEKRDWGLVDPSAAYAAIHTLVQTLTPSTVPSQARLPKSLVSLEKAIEYAAHVGSLAEVAAREVERLLERADEVHANLRGHSIRSHVLRLQKAVDEFARNFPTNNTNEVKSWNAAASRLQLEGLSSDPNTGTAGAVHAFLANAKETRPTAATAKSALLTFALRAPAQKLGLLLDHLRAGEKAILEFSKFLKPRVAQLGPAASIAEVKSFADRLITASRALSKDVT